ncbi:hypothetical protein [Halorussus salinisoli]|uniref:hypothetical protein n=1 Tax=Halorussus salinisoli TaxID=2558242 RepID=UPI0010C1C9C9|nr:hypothetical protein [Halorussus salinisoli]
MTKIDSVFPIDRVLTDETRAHIMSAYRRLLSAPESDFEEVEATEGLPLDIEVLHLQQFEDNSVHADVLLDHGDGPALVTDDVEECPHHVEGEEFSTLAVLGEEYAALEKDLVEVSALMCDLAEYHDELEKYAIGGVGFRNLSCCDGLLTFTFAWEVEDVIVRMYRDYEHELGEQVGISVDPSVEEMVEKD